MELKTTQPDVKFPSFIEPLKPENVHDPKGNLANDSFHCK